MIYLSLLVGQSIRFGSKRVVIKSVPKCVFLQRGLHFATESDSQSLDTGFGETFDQVIHCYICVGAYEDRMNNFKVNLCNT